MPHLQLEVLVEQPQSQAEHHATPAEKLEEACFLAGALSVTLADGADSPIFEPELNTTPLWPLVRLSALFLAESSRDVILAILTTQFGRPLPPVKFTEVADRIWEREWLADFRPMRFGARLWICPHGAQLKSPGARIVRLDPGLAFGTGTHPTTALCLEWLDGAALESRTVLDFGCGSGILAIAALKLGAARAICIDHDPQALLATRENAARNGVAQRLTALAPSDFAAARLGAVAQILLANILALPLIQLAGRFQALLPAGGELLLSGVLASQAAEVADAYRPWFDFAPARLREDWIRLHGTRR